MNNSFSLKKPANMGLFMPTDGTPTLTEPSLVTSNSIANISVDRLKHYRNHPFKLYQGERLNYMVESIKANGVMIPLLVVPLIADETVHSKEYEILAGHNRLEGAKIAGFTEVPCIIKEGLSEEEAHLIVTESNLIQRSFADLSHSERAVALSAHYNAIKHQGKRTDLIRQVEALLTGGDVIDDAENAVIETCTPASGKSIGVTGERYGLSKNSVARYVRVNSLIAGFKELLDSEELSLRAGVSLSYVDESRQHIILSQMQRYEVYPSMKQAEQLKKLATDTDMDKDADDGDESFLLGCADILVGRISDGKTSKPSKTIKFKLERSAVETYFNDDDTEETIQSKVMEALEFYHKFYERHKIETE